MTWLAEDRTALAAERILDAAARLFADQGVATTGMDEVAAAAGCSRATLYRYFDSRRALQQAFVHREALAIIEEVGDRVGEISDPTERAVEAVTACLAAVRSRPHLLTWYAGDAPLLAGILRESPLIEGFAARFVGEPQEFPDYELARWVIRAVLSFLAWPGADLDEERRMVERFLAPSMTVR